MKFVRIFMLNLNEKKKENLNEIYFMEKEFVKNNYKLKNNMYFLALA